MFAKLCGDDPLRNIVLATTMWDRVQDSKGEARQAELERKYWKEMLDHGSQTRRFNTRLDGDGGFNSAWKIIDAIPNKAIDILLLQDELLNLKRQLSETQAGMALYDQLQKLLAEHKDTLRKLREEAKGNDDEQLMQALNAEYDMVQRKLQGTFEQVAKLKLPWFRRYTINLPWLNKRSQIVCFPWMIFPATTDRPSRLRKRKCRWSEMSTNVHINSFCWGTRGCKLCLCVSRFL